MAAGHSVEPEHWQAETDRLLGRMAGRFVRVETRRRVRRFLFGLLADLPRKNCWTIAEHAGEADPHGMQYLLARARWDTDGVRDDLRDYVVAHLGDGDGVLVVDETGDLKKGAGTVRGATPVHRHGRADRERRQESSGVAVYLTYAGARGHAMLDRELYLPRCWADDPDRCAEAGVPADIAFATEPALAAGMLTRALRADVPARWVAGDEVYGNDPALRAECEAHRIGYVLAIGCDRRVPTPAGLVRPDTLTASLPRRVWQRLSAGAGAKGQRYDDWAWVTLRPAAISEDTGEGTSCWWLLIRRHPTTGELAFYRCYAPHLVPLRELVRVAGRRWSIEESFQAARGLAGLDEHQVRRWQSWQRWTLLAMAAHALLAVIAANEHADRPSLATMIPLTCNEIRRLLTVLVLEPRRSRACPRAWSDWRRQHQHRDRTCHYQRREAAHGRT